MLLLHQRCGHQLRRLHRMSATRSAPSPIVHRIVGETPGPSNLAGTDRLTCDGSEYAVAAHGTGDGYPTFRVDMVDVHAGPVWDLLATRSVTSTQRLVEQNAASLPQRCVVVADTQSKGKGRSGNVWVSPEGCLMFSSIHCLNLEGSKLPFAQYATTLAAVKSIDRLCNFELLGEVMQQHEGSLLVYLQIRESIISGWDIFAQGDNVVLNSCLNIRI